MTNVYAENETTVLGTMLRKLADDVDKYSDAIDSYEIIVSTSEGRNISQIHIETKELRNG